VDGVSFTLSGSTPADGDIFTVRPNGYQDLFSTLSSLIQGLEDPRMNAVGNAQRDRTLKAASDNFDAALDGILTVRASVGSRLKELDNLDSAGDSRNIQYQNQLSQLQDLDYVKALSDLTMQQTTLDAAQKSFVKTSSLSLFALL
jgi:flagellar hook-associated protein 3 FlgL